MQFRSTNKNPFLDPDNPETVSSPSAALYATASGGDEFVHPVKVNRTTRGIGHYPSLVMKRMVPFHSAPELTFCRYADVIYGIERYWMQPLRFNIMINGVLHLYTPDGGLIIEDGRRMMIEVKLKGDAESEKNQARWPHIRRELAALRYEFKVPDIDFSKDGLLAQRLDALQEYRRFEIDPLALFELKERLSNQVWWPISDVFREIRKLGQHPDLLFACVLRRELYLDLTVEVIDDSTPIYLSHNAPHAPLIWQESHA